MQPASELQVRPVEGKREWQKFFDLPRRLYQHDPVAPRPLRSMERLLLDEAKHPFYRHACRQAWICYRGSEVVGRIVAIKDDLHNQHHQDEVGFFGFLELIDDQNVLNELVRHASDWLRERGCQSLRGPVSPSMKGEFGVLVAGGDFPPYVMTGYSFGHYDRMLLAADFDVAKQFYAYRIQPGNADAEYQIRWERLEKTEKRLGNRFPQLRFKAVDKTNYEETLREINELGNDVRRHGWGFVPLTEDELHFMIKNLKRVIRFDMIHVAYWEDQLVGYIVNIPDVNWVLRKTVGRWDWLRMLQMPYWIKRCPRSRVIALGVHEDFRAKGIAIMLIKRLTDIWYNYEEWEFSWVAEDNLKSTRAIESVIELDRYKTWRLYERNLLELSATRTKPS